MYNTPTSSSSFNDTEESKYTVADILSSMANGEPLTSAFSGAVPFSTSTAPMVSTPLLTPTTLASLEQTFIELQSVPSGTTTAQNLSRQSGFVPPAVDQATSDYGDYDDDSDWLPTEAKRPRTAHTSVIVQASSTTGRRTGPRRSRDEKLNPEEEEKRKQRRERNKLAAARCRQRRVDLTNNLIQETEDLEEEQAELQQDIQSLQQQKEQLEFLLQAHKPRCQVSGGNQVKIKTEPEEGPQDLVIKHLPQAIKAEPTESCTSRPTSLPISSSVTEATGVTINTPSSVLLGLDSMVDGHTGLTPLTGPTCSSQVHRNSTDSSSGNENLASPTRLVSL